MKISIGQILFPLIMILFFLLLLGCGTYTPPKIASHVVAVTLAGDTILVPIDRIRPNMYDSYYPIYRSPYYYNNYNSGVNYQWRYKNNRGTSIKAKNTPKSVTSVPDITNRPSSEVLLKTKK